MIKEKITVYRCSHCLRKLYRSKNAMEVHEKMCFENPNRVCKRCGKSEVQKIIKFINKKHLAATLEYGIKLYKISNDELNKLVKGFGCSTCVYSAIRYLQKNDVVSFDNEHLKGFLLNDKQ